MSQKFKEYDKKFSAFYNTILETDITQEQAEIINEWKYHKDIILWTRAQIADAVYNSKSAENWQKFRVSLKGNSTRLKLLRLQRRYESNVIRASLAVEYEYKFEDINYGWQYKGEEDEIFYEKVRIDNYIGALRRQMSLNADYCVVKEI